MLTEYQYRRCFGKKREKAYYVVEKDGDTLGGLIAGPFENVEQCTLAIEALRPLHFRPLTYVGGHLVGWEWRPIGEASAEEV